MSWLCNKMRCTPTIVLVNGTGYRPLLKQVREECTATRHRRVGSTARSLSAGAKRSRHHAKPGARRERQLLPTRRCTRSARALPPEINPRRPNGFLDAGKGILIDRLQQVTERITVDEPGPGFRRPGSAGQSASPVEALSPSRSAWWSTTFRALLALPVSGRVATKAVASSATLAARHPVWRMTQKAKRLSTS